MKKYLFLILTLLLLLLPCLSACAIGGGGSGSGSGGSDGSDSGSDAGGDGGSEDGDAEQIYSPGVSCPLVYDGGASASVEKLASWLTTVTGEKPTSLTSSDAEAENEIVIGRCEREISKKAYRLMERIDRESEELVRYLIYSDGSSVAIAYDEEVLGIPFAEADALDFFIKEYCGANSLAMERGVAASKVYSVVERQREIDAVQLEEQWLEAKKSLAALYGTENADEIVASLRELYSIYSGDAISWLADLYDPEIGGFYYSNSARNNEGFLPDLESTYQALSLLEGTGALREVGGKVAEGIPARMQQQIISFTKSLQDPDNGYFYHPQWSRVLTDSLPQRRGRDLTNAVNILGKFSALPTYDTPSGIEGDGVLADGTPVLPAALKHAPLGSSAIACAARVLAVNAEDVNVTSHLRTKEAFIEYLNAQDLNGRSYYVGNLLESQANQILARDKVLAERGESYRLSDILADWFDRHQNKNTGTWYIEDTVDFEAVNGILKISSTYHRINKQIPNPDLCIRACMLMLTDPTPARHVCDILNPWYALTVIRNNLVMHKGSDAEYLAVLGEMVSKFPSYARMTMERLATLRREDGSFGYLPESSAPDAQGVPAAVPGSFEGDVNATYLATSGVMGHLFNALLVNDDRVQIFTEADRLRFLLTVQSLGEIIKDIPFDDRDSASGDYVRKYGGVYYIEQSSTYNLETVYRYTTEVRHDKDITKETHEYMQVVSDDDKLSGVLEYGKASLESYYGLCFGYSSGQEVGNCIVFETEIKINNIAEEVLGKIAAGSPPVLIDLQAAKTTDLTAANVSTNIFYDKIGAIYLKESGEEYTSAFSHPTVGWQYKGYGTMGRDFSSGSWYTVALELYGNGIAKYYVNNLYVGEARVLEDTSVFDEIDTMRFALNSKAVGCNVWLDNTYFGRINKDYVPGDKAVSYDGFVFEAGEYFENLGGLDYELAMVKPLENSGYLLRSTWYTKDNMEGKPQNEMTNEYLRISEGAAASRAGKVLEFTTLKSNGKGIYLRENIAPTGDVFVFEADISLTVDGASARSLLSRGEYYLASVSLASSAAATSVTSTDPNSTLAELCRIYVKADPEGRLRYYINRPYNSAGFGVCYAESEITEGWHRFTAEVYRDEGVIKYYIDGEYLSEYSAAEDVIRESFDEFNSVKLSFRDPIDNSTVWLDNSFIGRVKKTYVDEKPAPTPPATDVEGSLGEDNAPSYDKNGWD